jgi:hypothetical protein
MSIPTSDFCSLPPNHYIIEKSIQKTTFKIRQICIQSGIWALTRNGGKKRTKTKSNAKTGIVE